MNSLPKTVTQQRCGCDLNPGPSAPESSMLTTRLPSHSSSNSNCMLSQFLACNCGHIYSTSNPYTHFLLVVVQDDLPAPQLRTRGFCWSEVLLLACHG